MPPLRSLLFLTVSAAASAADLLKWDLPVSVTGGGATLAPAALPGVSGPGMALGAGLRATSAASTGWRHGGFDQTAADDTAFEAALAGGDFIFFSITAAVNHRVTVTGIANLKIFRTPAGPGTARLYYSTDNWAGKTLIGTTAGISTDGTAPTDASVVFNDFGGGIVLEAGQSAQFRIVAAGATSANGSFGLIGNSATGEDCILTGTVEELAVAKNLEWTGAAGNAWNTTDGNFRIIGGADAVFAAGDHVTLGIPAAINVDAAGVAAGNVTHSAGEGTVVSLSGGPLAAQSLTKTGAGILSLASVNTFANGSTVSAGTIFPGKPLSLDTTTVNLSNAAVLKTGSFPPDDGSTMSNVFHIDTGGAIIDNSDALTLTGKIHIPVAGTPLAKTGEGVLTLDGGIGTQTTAPADFDVLSGVVILTGSGSARQKNVTGTSTFDGIVHLRSGATLELHGSTVEGAGSLVCDSGSATLSARLHAGAVTIALPITLNNGLNIDVPNGGNAMSIDGVLSGTGWLDCSGNGVKTIRGANACEGTSTLSEGTLYLRNTTGSATGTGGILVSGTGVLGGGGSSVGVVSTSGSTAKISPGLAAATGTLTLGGLILGGPLAIEVSDADVDKVVVTGAMDILFGTLDLTVVPDGSGFTRPVYVFASYDTLSGPFAAVSGMPAGFELDYSYHDGVSDRNIALVATAGFAFWMAANYPALTGDDALPGADPDADGMANLAEFVLGTAPDAPDIPPVQATLGPAGLEITFLRRDESEGTTTIRVQWSNDLTTWTDIAVTPADLVNENGDAPDDMKVVVPHANVANGRLIGRIAVATP